MGTDAQLLKHIELLIGSIGVMLSLFFSAFLLITQKKQPRANIFLTVYLVAFSLRIGKSLFFNYFPIDPIIRNIFLGVLLTIGPSVWFYTNYLLQPNTNSSRSKILWHYVPALLYVLFCWFIPNNRSTVAQLFYTALILHMFGYTLFSLLWLFKQTKEMNANEAITKWLHYFLGITLFMVIIYFLISNNVIPYYLGTAFLFSAVIIFFGIWALKNPVLFKVDEEKYVNSSLSPAASKRIVVQLNDLMTNERLFLDPNLTLVKTSERLGVTSKQVSQAINQVHQKNYSQYIAEFRVEEAKRLLRLAEYDNYKISSIAYDSGFNSISSFNTTFKKLTRSTAIAYRKSLS